ncbi:MAG: tetratricopeptide repeat protein [Kiritimatiellae bacterium]|nr:tetratricopeptide repeat protein [Kiritimatiellia bacterium]
MKPPAAAAARRVDLVAPLLIVAVGLCCYANAFYCSFHFDDKPAIVDNETIRDPGNIRAIWERNPFRFVTYLTLALNYRFGGLGVFGYHLVNNALHIATGLLLWWLVRLLLAAPGGAGPPFSRRMTPLLPALLFVAHPVQTQAVTYIVQRAACLATLFYLLAMVCHLKAAHTRPDAARQRLLWSAGAVTGTVLAMFSKEIAFTLPFAILLLEAAFSPAAGTGRKKRLLRLLPVISVGVAVPLCALCHPGTIQGLATEARIIPRTHYLLTQFHVMRTYIRLLVWPWPQNVDYHYPIATTLWELPTLLSLGCLLLVGAAGVALFRRNRLVGFGILFFFLALSVESSVVPLRDVIFEHRLYLPMAGFTMVLAGGAAAGLSALQRRGVRPRAIRLGWIALTALLTGAAGWATHRRNETWRDELALWRDVVAKSPNKGRGHNNLGLALAAMGRLDEAAAQYSRALEVDPFYGKAHHNLGLIFAGRKDYDAALLHFSAALELDPRNEDLPGNLGAAFANAGDYTNAVVQFSEAVRRNPDSLKARLNLGDAFERQDRYALAVEHYSRALELAPDAPKVHKKLGQSLAESGQLTPALAHFSRVLADVPHSAEAHNDFGLALKKLGQVERAVDHYRQALESDPACAKAHNNLGVVFATRERYDEAILHFSAAVESDPDFAEAHGNLGLALRLRGDREAAITHFSKALRIQPDFEKARRSLETLLREREARPRE